MARPIHKLSARTVETVGPGRHSDGGGLYLRVTDSGTRRWVFRYSDPRTRTLREAGLGSAGKLGLSLAAARQEAARIREMIRVGEDPLKPVPPPEPEKPAITFGDFADSFVKTQTPGFRNKKHAAQWHTTLATYGEPLRALPLSHINTDAIIKVLTPIWLEKPETASRVRGRIERVLDAAKALGLREGENPARWRGHLSLLLPRQPKLSRGHHKALPYSQVPSFMDSLRIRPGVAARALEFMILTAARSGEVRLMSWDEIDTEAMVWTVPATRMKAGRAHRVPLTPHLVAFLRKHGTDERERGHIFVGVRDKRPLTDAAVSAVLKRMNVPVTVHGFRSSFRDWAGDKTEVPREVAEAALAHIVGDAAEQAYRRGDALDRRAELMTKWQDYCNGALSAQARRRSMTKRIR